MAGLGDVGLVVDFVVVVITGLVLVHLLLFLPCLSHIIFNLAPNYNPLILLYCAIYFLTLSIFYLILFTYCFLYSLLCFTLFSGVIHQDMAILKFLLSQNSTGPRCFNLMLHYLYILPVLFFPFISQAITMMYTWDSFLLIFGILDEPPCYVWQCTMLLKFV